MVVTLEWPSSRSTCAAAFPQPHPGDRWPQLLADSATRASVAVGRAAEGVAIGDFGLGIAGPASLLGASGLLLPETRGSWWRAGRVQQT